METMGIKERKAYHIIKTSLELFCRQGIEDTKVEDVAKAAKVGPATIYRYYETKAELTIQCAIWYWKEMANRYLPLIQSERYMKLDGRGKVNCILDIFVRMYRDETAFLRFLHEFDVYVQKEGISTKRLEEYERNILDLKVYVTDAMEEGIRDGTLYNPYTMDELYFTLTHTLLSLMQKLASLGRIVNSDDMVANVRQVEIAKELLLQGITRRDER
ncbi:TetR/AcrR family transcriptional regulator [Bariatricus sp. SGI.154]|uniref:TetR/AcrR family transcriptional regulator n=1 Tax=Bariatricus sp. SGI.154 TaxID=3420549 RepID=UPI003CFC2450